MTVTYGFYDSLSSDRTYNAVQWSQIFDGIINDGVYASIGSKFFVSPNTGMAVYVGTGRAWFNGTWTYVDAPYSITLDNADPLLPRIDVIYLEVNKDTGVRANKFDKLTGTPASSPVAPTLTETSTSWQYPIAHIYVGANVSSIVQGVITYKVGLTETPFVTGIVSVITTNEIIAQWEAQWDAWFQAIQDQLSSEAETNLQNQIWTIVGDINPPLIDLIELKNHDHSDINTSPIPEDGIATNAISEIKIKASAVTNAKLATDAVSTIKLQDLSVTNAKLGSASVSSSKISNNAVTLGKIASSAVATSNILDGNVTRDKLATEYKQGWVPVMACKDNGGVFTDYYGAYYHGITMDNNTYGKLMGSFIVPADYVVGGTFDFGVAAVVTNGNGAFRLKLHWYPVEFNPVTPETMTPIPEHTKEFTHLNTYGVGVYTQVHIESMGSPGFSLEPYDYVGFAFSRLYTHAEDTATGEFNVLGFWYSYQGKG